MVSFYIVLCFFFKQKTAYEMRISDWSSDVCSSDLEGGRRPTVVLAGGWCYVREVTMPTYAQKFAENGFNALIIDYRNLGVSGGDNRQHLDPWAQIRDYQNAISFLERHPAVDPDKIGAWGISYSGGHVIILAAIDERVKTVISHVPVIDGYENMRRIHGVNGWRQLLKL